MRQFLFSCMLTLAGLAVFIITPIAHAIVWPQAIDNELGQLTVYQPQPEDLRGKTLTGRAAMSMALSGEKEPVWGVFWFSADIDTDRSTDSATISNIKVDKVRWPDSRDSGEAKFAEVVEQELTNTQFDISISQLKASLAVAEREQESLDNLKHDAPPIIFSDELAILLTFDGEPIFKKIDNSSYKRAINTPLAVASNSKQTQFYLTSGALWYSAKQATGPWQLTNDVPKELKQLVNTDSSEKPAHIPKVIVVTEPTELIATDGQPKWVSLVGGKLMYVENTETPWLRELASGKIYVQLSGRWFSSKDQDGPWTFVRPDKLPKSFSQIPPESDLGSLRSSVAGTDEANEAATNTQIPQTAAVKRNDNTIAVNYYEGKAKFEPIKGTKLSYGVNTASQVLEYEGKYYAVEDAIWYVANTPNGPWVVADEIPANEIAKIPPSSPAYNMTFVSIYGSNSDVVYVGYTPGYYWSYPYYGVPIYGTGWYYPPYTGPWYYPRPPTWGFHVHYNSNGGWGFGFSWGGPFYNVGISWGGYYNNHWYGGHYNINNININNTGDINIGNTNNIKNNIKNRRDNNIYKDSRVKDKIAATPKLNSQLKNAKPLDKANNVMADRDGHVVRKTGDKWQQVSDGKWQDIDTGDISKQQVKDRATDFSSSHNIDKAAIGNKVQSHRNDLSGASSISRPSNTSQPSPSISSQPSINRSSISNRASSFNRSSMNRQFNARSRGMSGASNFRRR